jgi:hypothetical protein
MPRKRPSPETGRQDNPPAQPHVIDPNAVYDLVTVRAALGLKLSTIRTAWRRQGLKISRRAGKVYILGRWLLDWLEAGVSDPKAKAKA